MTRKCCNHTLEHSNRSACYVYISKEDWRLDVPTGKSDEEFKKVISTIETKIKELKAKLKL